MHKRLISRIHALQCLKHGLHDTGSSAIWQAHPQIGIVFLIGQITSINRLYRYISSKDYRSERFSLEADHRLVRVQYCWQKARVLVSLVSLGWIQLSFSSLSLGVVIAEDLVQYAGHAIKIILRELNYHLIAFWLLFLSFFCAKMCLFRELNLKRGFKNFIVNLKLRNTKI